MHLFSDLYNTSGVEICFEKACKVAYVVLSVLPTAILNSLNCTNKTCARRSRAQRSIEIFNCKTG